MPQPEPTHTAPLLWAEVKFFGSTVVLTGSASGLLAAALPAYDPQPG